MTFRTETDDLLCSFLPFLQTFTRWCNTHLVALNLVIEKLEDDLANGYMLHQLVTVLSQRTLAKPVKAPNSKFQKLQNLNTALDALVKLEGVKLVNISAEDIINGNSKLDLGCTFCSFAPFFLSTPFCSRSNGLFSDSDH